MKNVVKLDEKRGKTLYPAQSFIKDVCRGRFGRGQEEQKPSGGIPSVPFVPSVVVPGATPTALLYGTVR
jgi:hypothetical protein